MGLGPAAQYLLYGTWPTPQMNYWWQSGQLPYGFPGGWPSAGFATPFDPWGAGSLSPEDELNFLKGQAEVLEDELSGIRDRIKELEGKT